MNTSPIFPHSLSVSMVKMNRSTIKSWHLRRKHVSQCCCHKNSLYLCFWFAMSTRFMQNTGSYWTAYSAVFIPCRHLFASYLCIVKSPHMNPHARTHNKQNITPCIANNLRWSGKLCLISKSKSPNLHVAKLRTHYMAKGTCPPDHESHKFCYSV